MKKPLFKPRQLLVLAYLLAAVFWVVRCLVGCGVMLNYQLQGKMPQTHLDAADLVTESFAPYSSNEWWTPPDDDPASLAGFSTRERFAKRYVPYRELRILAERFLFHRKVLLSHMNVSRYFL